jgi:hypothetical protein
VPVLVDRYCPQPFVMLDLSRIHAGDHPGYPAPLAISELDPGLPVTAYHETPVGFRPLSTRAVTAARPLLDALGDAVHRTRP